MLRGSIIERDELLILVSGERSPRAESISLEEIRRGLNAGRYAMLWESAKQANSGGRPLLVVNDTGLKEFFSFVGTYVNSYVPFSAFYRVISLNHLADLSADNQLLLYRKDIPNLDQRMIGLAIAEAALRRRDGLKRIENLSVGEVRSTLASTLLGAAASLGEEAPLSDISARWSYLADRVSEGESRTLTGDVAEVFSKVVAPLSGSNNDRGYVQSSAFSQVVRDVAREGMISEHHWAVISERAPQIASTYQNLRGPREDRVKVLSATLASVQSYARDDKGYAACLAGCILALVGDGSFQYLPLALDLSNDPQTVMWFAGWSSLMSRTDVLTIGSSLGARSARDVFVSDSIYSSPKADISFDELRTNGLGFAKSGRSSSSESLVIEVYPTIYSYFQVNNSRTDDRLAIDDSSIRLIEEAQQYIDRARLSLGRALEGRKSNRSRNRPRS